ncbi:MAG: tetratricopeptide repeat protein [Trueperaceae bacterium]|nr:tetratricopeptide repeat protein [Trueperaceae bacterium]
MTLPILATKLFQPKVKSNWVHRGQLLEKLNKGLERKFSLLSAPAGFGKTTLVSSWLAEQNRRVAWLSLDDKDSEPRRFFSHLIAALETISPTFTEELGKMLEAPGFASDDTFLTSLLNSLASVEASFFLVLDDYHLIDNSEIDAALAFLLDHQPPQLHLVMTTREDPPLPLSRLRVRGELTEVRASDLKFDHTEVAEFLSKLTGLRLSEQDILLLEERTEGWAAGLQLAALSMHGLDDTASFIEAFAGDHHLVLDYLAEEVLQTLPERERLFLLQTSVLERFSAPLCNALTKQENADEVLVSLEQRNLFLIPLDNKREWFRYHHLFADVLQARLRKEQPDRVGDLHERASHWFEKNNLVSEAIHHAFAAAAFEHAAAIIEKAWRAMDISFQSDLWLSWANKLPKELLRVRPVLSAGYAWALLNQGEFEAMEPYLANAERWLEDSSNQPLDEKVVSDEAEFKALPVTIASARAYKAQALGDMPATILHSRTALAFLSEDDYQRRGIPLALLGLAYWTSGNLEEAFKSTAEGMTAFEKTGEIMASISGVFAMADMKIGLGRLHEAIAVYEQALAFVAKQKTAIHERVAILHLGLGELYLEQGKLESAKEHLQQSKALEEVNTDIMHSYRNLLFQAKRLAAQDDFGAALTYLEDAEKTFAQIHVPDLKPVAALKAEIWLKQGEIRKALTWVHERNLKADDELSYLREFEHMTLARVFIAQYQHDKKNESIEMALKLLARLLEAAREANRMGVVIAILILQALAHQAKQNMPAALESLTQALKLAEPEAYLRTFIDEGLAMKKLLSEAKTRGILPAYVTQLLLAFETQQKATTRSDLLTQASNQALGEPLTERELEVLRLLAEGLSNREISKQLFRALDTVKGYNRNIFGKLQVQDRNEAVAKARDLNLL